LPLYQSRIFSCPDNRVVVRVLRRGPIAAYHLNFRTATLPLSANFAPATLPLSANFAPATLPLSANFAPATLPLSANSAQPPKALVKLYQSFANR
jgi:hypothetical protein